MKVLLVYLGRRGGLANYSLEIAKALKSKVDLFPVISAQVENLGQWGKEFSSVYKINTYSSAFGFLLSFFNVKKFFKLYKKIKEFSPDVIYYPAFHFWLPIINFLFPKVPKVFTLHDPVLHSGEQDFLTASLQSNLLRKSSRLIILSSTFKDLLIKKGVRPENIDVIPHGPNNYSHTGIAETHNPTLLFFGRILEYKGLDVLFKAFPIIKKELPEARLIVAGNGEITRKSSTKYIIFENRWIRDEEIEKYFAESDVLICPYLEASQSGVIPVAYSYKVPVIASRVGGLAEQVEDGVTGILVKPNGPEELARACIYLLKDKEKRREMGENGYKKVEGEWNWDVISNKVLDSLRRALKF